MTTEERFERIEQVTASLVEERRKDREEYRQLWRDTQRQIAELSVKIADTNDTVARVAEELARQIATSDARAKAAEQELRDRIQGLVSGIGELLDRLTPTKKPQE